MAWARNVRELLLLVAALVLGSRGFASALVVPPVRN